VHPYDEPFQITGWKSGLPSVNEYLLHYKRKTESDHVRRNALEALYRLATFVSKNPEELVKLRPKEASKSVQRYLDDMKDRDLSVRYINVTLAYLQMFFIANGFKNGKSLEVERYHQPARYRKKPEYIPTLEEAFKMAEYSGSIKGRAIILCLVTSGLRNSTLRALRYKDIKGEFEAGKETITVPVYPEMKSVVPDACKSSIPYFTFFNKDAVESLCHWLAERDSRLGAKIADEDPIFNAEFTRIPREKWTSSPMGATWLQRLVKRSAKRAGLQRWNDVYTHTLRKTFEGAVRNAGLDGKDQEFLMGHILPGSQDPYYDKTRVEELKAKYAKIRFFGTDVGKIRRQTAMDQIRILKELNLFPGETLDALASQLQEKTVDEIDWTEMVARVKQAGQLITKQEHGKQKAVKAEEVEGLLEKGWRFVAPLADGKVIVETPSTQ
jgi:integrase